MIQQFHFQVYTKKKHQKEGVGELAAFPYSQQCYSE